MKNLTKEQIESVIEWMNTWEQLKDTAIPIRFKEDYTKQLQQANVGHLENLRPMNYNLTFWQKLELIPIWFLWASREPHKRKTWHEVKKGMEKHEHKFTKPFTQQGHKFLQCEHDGCNICEAVDL